MLPSSRTRFLLLKVAAPAAIGNVVINALLGAAIFRAGHPVPLLGNPSVGADTLVGSFLIGSVTWVGVLPMAGLEARSGRVRGFGLRGRTLAWTRAHPFLGAFVVGVLLVFGIGVPLMQRLVGRGLAEMPRDVFLAFKASYAGAVGVLAAIVAALVGLAPEEEVKDRRAWCLDPAVPLGGPTYPCEYMDKASLAVTDRVRGCTGAPTWDLHVKGALDPEHVRRALEHTAKRYPSLATKVEALDGVPPFARTYRYAFDPTFSVARIFEVIDARGDEKRTEETARELRSRYLDPFADFLVTLTMIRTGQDSCRLVFRQHHAIADGRAIIGMLVDFAAYLEDARAGREPAATALAPIGRRGDVEALGLSPWRRVTLTLGGGAWWIGTILRSLFRPLVPLQQNTSNDYSGENATVHWAVSDDVLGAWNAARKRLDVSLNTLLTGALFLANQRSQRGKGLPLGRTNAQLLMETRPRDAAFVSFANHLTFLEAEADLSRDLEPAALLRSIQAQVVSQRDREIPSKRLLWERMGVLLLPLEQLQKMIFETKRPAYNLNFSNLIPLDFATLGGEGWSVDDVRITTPVAPRHGIVLTVIRYSGKLVFNFNYKTTAATRESAEELCREFRSVLSELTATSTTTSLGGE